MPGIRQNVGKMWAQAATMVRSKTQNRAYLHKSSQSIGAGGGTRTLKLFRARAPKTRAVANFATPAWPSDRTVSAAGE
jgi:hypothetical protein